MDRLLRDWDMINRSAVRAALTAVIGLLIFERIQASSAANHFLLLQFFSYNALRCRLYKFPFKDQKYLVLQGCNAVLIDIYTLSADLNCELFQPQIIKWQIVLAIGLKTTNFFFPQIGNRNNRKSRYQIIVRWRTMVYDA